MASSYLQRTVGTPTNAQKYTYSFWVKRCELSDGSKECFLLDGYADASNRAKIAFQSGDQLEIWNSHGGSDTFALNPPRKFRDISAWYHIVLSVDTTQSTASDRVKLYVNGVQETSLGSTTYPSQNDANNTINESGTTFSIMAYGANASSDAYRLSSIMSHVYFTDGYAYDASAFGSTDSVTGEWKINTSPSITMGNNGFTILKDGNTITDQSSNSNNFTLGGGTLTNTEDNPSNNFCTLNFLDRARTATNNLGDALENGNTTFNTSNAVKATARGTIGVTSGKYYWEGKYNGGTAWAMGICLEDLFGDTTAQFWDSSSILAVAINGGSGTLYVNGRSSDSWNTGVSFSSGDIFGFALDVDNKALYVHRNGTYLTANSNVGDPTSGSSRTGSVLGELTTGGYQNYIPDGKPIFPFCQDVSTGAPTTMYMNFGNGYFGTTAVATNSGNGYAGAEGSSIFNYQPPTGYSALSTKGLNT